MRLGKRHLDALAASLPVLAGTYYSPLIVAVWSVAKISLLPPRLTPRALEMATATTHVVVDTPKSTVLDLRQNTDDLQALTERAYWSATSSPMSRLPQPSLAVRTCRPTAASDRLR